MFKGVGIEENTKLNINRRVAPVLKEQINAGKINLTAIVNTHQSVSQDGVYPANYANLRKAIGIMPEETTNWYAEPKLLIPIQSPKLMVPLTQLALPEFKGKPIIAGKDSEGVTQTPKNGEGFKIGDIAVKALYTPCHTQDSICWFMEDSTGRAVFTGDTLFHGGMVLAADHFVDLADIG
jgi:hydroxyacylglutathione hydrolase